MMLNPLIVVVVNAYLIQSSAKTMKNLFQNGLKYLNNLLAKIMLIVTNHSYKLLKQYTLWATIINILLLLMVACAFADDIVIQTIAREASSEPIEAQIYVARVIITRAQERGLSYDQVCLQPKQFSCWGIKQKPRTARELKTALKAWNIALSLDVKVNLYHDTSVTPYWAKKVKFIKQIGNLKFYREEKE